MALPKITARIAFLLLIFFTLSACGVDEPAPTNTPTATRTEFPTSVPRTNTPIPSATATLRPSSTPLPTNTLPPSFTPPPSSTPITPTPGIVGIGVDSGPFRDDFSDPGSGWVNDGGEGWSIGYSSGGYAIFNELYNTEVCSSRTRLHTDVVISVEATKLEGSDNTYYGVTCRKNINNLYTLGISGSGGYVIYRTIGDDRTLLVEGESPAINQGNNVSNTIQASCIGNILSLSVNGTEVVTVLDNVLLSGTQVGLSAGTVLQPDPGILVLFDNFSSEPVAGAPPFPSPTTTLTGSETPVPSATSSPQ